MKEEFKYFLLAIIAVLALGSCQKDTEPNLPSPSIDNVEIGLNNDEIGVIGEDFHLNADLLAGELIELVKIQINPIDEESYEAYWDFEVIWEEYKGARNTTVHKHFDIPEDAVEGFYDFLIIVTDQNGTITEEKRSITIYKEENLPANP